MLIWPVHRTRHMKIMNKYTQFVILKEDNYATDMLPALKHWVEVEKPLSALTQNKLCELCAYYVVLSSF